MIKRVVANFISVNDDILINGIPINRLFSQPLQEYINNVILQENVHPGLYAETTILQIISIMLRINLFLYQIDRNTVIYYVLILRA